MSVWSRIASYLAAWIVNGPGASYSIPPPSYDVASSDGPERELVGGRAYLRAGPFVVILRTSRSGGTAYSSTQASRYFRLEVSLSATTFISARTAL